MAAAIVHGYCWLDWAWFMNRLLRSMTTLEFWNELSEHAKWLVALSYLSHLSSIDHHVGFWTVLLIFSFKPAAQCIHSKLKT